MSEVRKFVLYITEGNYKAIAKLLRVDGHRFKGLFLLTPNKGIQIQLQNKHIVVGSLINK